MAGLTGTTGPGRISYSNITSGRRPRKKKNILEIILERDDRSIAYRLTKEELGKLLFGKLKVAESDIDGIDTSSRFGAVCVTLREGVNPQQFCKPQSIEIRSGLRTKFCKPRHGLEVMVTVSWADPETPDGLVNHVFSHFGKIKTSPNNQLGIIHGTFKTAEEEGTWAKKLNNISNGERKFWMVVEKPLPSYAILDGKRVMVRHQGQRWTCARCHGDRESCPGEADAKKCEDKGGAKVDLRQAWLAQLEKVGYTQWEGGEIDTCEEEVTEEDQLYNKEELLENCDTILVRGFSDTMTDREIIELFIEAG